MSMKHLAAAASLKTLSKKIVAKLSPKSKKYYKDDQERKRKEKEASAIQLFVQPQKMRKPNKEMIDGQILDYLTSIIQIKPFPLTTTEAKTTNPLSNKYNAYVKLACNCYKLQVPSIGELNEVDRAQEEYSELKNLKLEPGDYVEKAAPLLQKIKSVKARLKTMI